MKTVLTAQPFFYWRWGSMGATCVAIFFGLTHEGGLAVACTVMAVGWALCDVVAWRDLKRVTLPTDAAIEAAAMEFGKNAYNGYPGPGPRSQFCDGAKWAREQMR